MMGEREEGRMKGEAGGGESEGCGSVLYVIRQ